MKYIIVLIFSILTFSYALASECDCTLYPFKPNPPCFGSCVAKLSASPHNSLSLVKNIDPGVSLSIKVLSAHKAGINVDFSKITGKKALEEEALKAYKPINLNYSN